MKIVNTTELNEKFNNCPTQAHKYEIEGGKVHCSKPSYSSKRLL